MAGERRFTRIPPESSGDRIYMKHTSTIPYDAKDPAYVWKVGETYVIEGNFGDTIYCILNSVDEVDSDGAASTTKGFIHVRYEEMNEFQNYNAVDDQNIYEEGQSLGVDTPKALVNGTAYDVYTNTTHIVGINNPSYATEVDRFGSLNTRFSEGAPELTSYNKLRVSNPILLGQYDFSEQSLRSQFATSQEGSGETVWQPDFGHIKISGYLTGDRATYTSSLWHPCPAGAGVKFIFAARTSSAGNATDGTLRFWGAFDATDGAFFALVQNQLSIRHRWTINGITNNVAVSQADWNQDTLDGTGGVKNTSGMNLDTTKQNLYWVDFQHYGGGRIRWGVYYQGERITCHVMDMGNGQMPGNVLYNAFSNPSRPLCWSCAKRSDPVVPGGSPDPLTEEAIYAYGGAVWLEADADLLQEGNYRQYADNYTIDGNSTSTTYLTTLRPQASNSEIDAAVANGDATFTGENHTLYAPQKLEITAVGDRIQITDADVATNVLTVTTSVPHYLAVDDAVDVYGTATVNGRYTVTAVTSPTIFTANAPGVANTTNETGELVGPKDGDTDSRMLEVRLFQKCIMRGTSYKNINFTTVEEDEYGDHIAHGPEFARFVVDGRYTYDFFDHFNRIQNGTVRNGSDQSFSRGFQTLLSLVGDDDKYSTGVQRVRAQVGPHPTFGTTIHYFDDKGRVIVRRKDRDGTNNKEFDNTDYTGIKNTEGDWHYLSILDRDEAWLYNSTADIDDDRSVRVLQLNADPTGTIAVGGTVTLDTGGHTAVAKAIYVDGGNFYLGVEARSNAAFDGYTGTINTSAFTVSGVTKSSDRIGSWGGIGGGTWDEEDERTTFDLDYKTSLLAVDSSAWTTSNADIVAVESEAIVLYGPDTFQPAWTFMARNLEPHKTDTTVRMNMSWKERVQ